MQNQEQVVVENDVVLDDDLSFLDDLEDLVGDDLEGLEDQPEEEVEDYDDSLVTVLDDNSEELLASAVEAVETEEEMEQIYADQVVDTPARVIEVTGGVEGSDEAEAEEVEVKETKVKAKKKIGTVAERIAANMGSEFIDMTTLSPDWAGKSQADHEADFAKIVNDMALYVGDKAVNLFTFLKVGSGLNEVTRRGFEVFLRDEQLVGGDRGNIVNNLLSKPYSLGTARSQSNQLLQLFTDLEIGKRTARGVVVVNPESIILERVKKLMGK